ncbi:MAG: heme ABC transporter ATP-binding protein CcmA [Alphaproteobacteria bacterium]|nr:heme ABC transporter ATP-binding protein CcmA [Alphaproteobacteria bacterium]|tara:strand:+ start:2512 stop:3246 length:735 start_codon:yes stop_codon:yes gene_type:complete
MELYGGYMNIDNKQKGELKANNLTCVRGEKTIFSKVNFTLSRGEALLVTGPNGIGKSSLLRVLSGFLKPSKGELSWRDGSVYQNIEEYRTLVHFVGHSDCIKSSLTVFEHLLFWSRLRGNSSLAYEALERTGLLNLAQTPGRFLSAGQKKRVSIARLISTYSPLWFLDEPTVTLDADSEKKLEELIIDHRSGGGIVVVATHSKFRLDQALNLDMGLKAIEEDESEKQKLKTYENKNKQDTWEEW